MGEAELVERAMRHRRLLKCNYEAYSRIVEPHAFAQGGEVLVAWQVAGGCASGPPIGWKEFRMSGIAGLAILAETFEPRPLDGGAGMPPGDASTPWKVLVVDDEVEVHRVTRLALDGFTVEGRELRLLYASSAAHAREVLAEQRDIALVLLDVVMESDHAGLDLIGHIRQSLGDRLVRIIVRTGQPGRAPEHEIARRYEIDDYRNKTEATFHSLSAAVRRALRNYRELKLAAGAAGQSAGAAG